MNERLERSRISVFRAVFPGQTNHNNTLFGGEVLSWMDEVAFVCGTRFCRKPLVTISTDRVDFKCPIPAGSIVELIAEVCEIGTTSMMVEVILYVEKMDSDEREQAVSGRIKFVALDALGNPTQVV